MKARLRWFQFRLRTLFLWALVASVALSWLAVRVERARKEREAFRATIDLGGQCWCNYEDPYVLRPRDDIYVGAGEQPLPAWLRAQEKLFGSDVLGWRHVTGVVLDCDNSLRRAGGRLSAAECAAACGRLAGLPQLRTLALIDGAVTDGCLDFLDRGPALVELSLDNTQVTDAGLAHMERLPQLEVLSIQWCPVTDAGLRHLRGLARLRSLNLTGTRVTGLGLECLRGHTAITVLELGETRATDTGLQAVAGLPQLKKLGLAHTTVTDAGLPWLAGLSQLAELSLEHTSVTAAGLTKLRRALPKCHISK